MRNNIVEGEPGIFPDPIARLLTRLGRLARRQRTDPPPPPEPGQAAPSPPAEAPRQTDVEGASGPDQGAS